MSLCKLLFTTTLSAALLAGVFSLAAAELRASACQGPAQKLHEESSVAIGGIEQWVTIKGDSCANPVILFLHRGPGNPMSPCADAIYAAWEKEFTLVQFQKQIESALGRRAIRGISGRPSKQAQSDDRERELP